MIRFRPFSRIRERIIPIVSINAHTVRLETSAPVISTTKSAWRSLEWNINRSLLARSLNVIYISHLSFSNSCLWNNQSRFWRFCCYSSQSWSTSCCFWTRCLPKWGFDVSGIWKPEVLSGLRSYLLTWMLSKFLPCSRILSMGECFLGKTWFLCLDIPQLLLFLNSDIFQGKHASGW